MPLFYSSGGNMGCYGKLATWADENDFDCDEANPVAQRLCWCFTDGPAPATPTAEPTAEPTAIVAAPTGAWEVSDFSQSCTALCESNGAKCSSEATENKRNLG